METMFDRTTTLLGEERVQNLKTKKVLVFGIGGVGGYVVEMLARAGVQQLTLVDSDVVAISNLNRQIIALNSTIGQAKVEVMKNRILDINPDAKVQTIQKFVTKDNVRDFEFCDFDFVVDAIDNVTAKLEIAKLCDEQNINLISCMGTGNKVDISGFKICDIYKTSGCPLARAVRQNAAKMGIKKLDVLYSSEKPFKTGERVPASICYVPSMAGIMIAEFVIKKMLNI